MTTSRYMTPGKQIFEKMSHFIFDKTGTGYPNNYIPHMDGWKLFVSLILEHSKEHV